LRNCVDTLWHIDNGKIHTFTGHYDDYLNEMSVRRASIELVLSRLQRQKKDMHQVLMKEQSRAAKSRAKGEKSISHRKWPTVVSNAKASRSQETSGRKKAEISDKKLELCQRLSSLRLPEIIKPKFSLSATDIEKKVIVSVSEGSVSYKNNKSLLSDINFSVMAGDRLAIAGDNGCGKSTLVKAIMNDPEILKSGNWHVPKWDEIGYLDQHYKTLSSHLTVLETLENFIPYWKPVDLRRHLCDFLFRKNEEVNALVSTLSGGEKARLTLAQIAAKTPKLLILDEVTNNLDLDTREHVIQVLLGYPGSVIVISHDEDFLSAIDINESYLIKGNQR
jgi:ATPase subunit of ABC transporter with duplicated ATPase domains